MPRHIAFRQLSPEPDLESRHPHPRVIFILIGGLPRAHGRLVGQFGGSIWACFIFEVESVDGFGRRDKSSDVFLRFGSVDGGRGWMRDLGLR